MDFELRYTKWFGAELNEYQFILSICSSRSLVRIASHRDIYFFICGYGIVGAMIRLVKILCVRWSHTAERFRSIQSSAVQYDELKVVDCVFKDVDYASSGRSA